MRSPLLAVLACVLGVAAAALAACGDTNGLLSANEAQRLKSGLDSVASAAVRGRCGQLESVAASLERRLQQLPSNVDNTIRTGLEQKVAQLQTVAQRECAQAEAPQTQQQTTQTQAPPPLPTETTTTTETQTQPTTPTETTTQPTTPTEPQTQPTQPDTSGGGVAPGGGNPPSDDGGVSSGGTRQREEG